MQDIKLVRIVRPRVVQHHGRVCVEDEVKTLYVKFTDSDGKDVSLAFDGRSDRDGDGTGAICETYTFFADCPVQFNGTDVRDRNVVRALRDALNALNLDD